VASQFPLGLRLSPNSFDVRVVDSPVSAQMGPDAKNLSLPFIQGLQTGVYRVIPEHQLVRVLDR
jgi:hypothetical protein